LIVFVWSIGVATVVNWLNFGVLVESVSDPACVYPQKLLTTYPSKPTNPSLPPSQRKNSEHSIGGSLLLTNPFSPVYQIEQTIEGSIFTVLRLWSLIKDDTRVGYINSCSHAFGEVKLYKRWGMQVSCDCRRERVYRRVGAGMGRLRKL